MKRTSKQKKGGPLLPRPKPKPRPKTNGKELFEKLLGEEMHGHPKFYDLLIDLGKLHSDKNHDYAKGGHPLGNFYRRATIYSLYPGLDLSDPAVVAMVDAMKQFDAFLWMKSQGHEAKVEGKKSRLKDVSVYSDIAIVIEEEAEED